MNNKFITLMSMLIMIMLVTSACSTKSSEGSSDSSQTAAPAEQVTEEGQAEAPANEPAEAPANEPAENAQEPADSEEAGAAEEASNGILIIIDQTPKPIEGNSFDFVVKQVPEGYSLAEMQWLSEKSMIINSLQEAIEHGANGEDGFYISGNGDYMGFFYPDEMKGEKGTVVFTFTNDAGEVLTWKKELTLTANTETESEQPAAG